MASGRARAALLCQSRSPQLAAAAGELELLPTLLRLLRITQCQQQEQRRGLGTSAAAAASSAAAADSLEACRALQQQVACLGFLHSAISSFSGSTPWPPGQRRHPWKPLSTRGLHAAAGGEAAGAAAAAGGGGSAAAAADGEGRVDGGTMAREAALTVEYLRTRVRGVPARMRCAAPAQEPCRVALWLLTLCAAACCRSSVHSSSHACPAAHPRHACRQGCRGSRRSERWSGCGTLRRQSTRHATGAAWVTWGLAPCPAPLRTSHAALGPLTQAPRLPHALRLPPAVLPAPGPGHFLL